MGSVSVNFGKDTGNNSMGYVLLILARKLRRKQCVLYLNLADTGKETIGFVFLN